MHSQIDRKPLVVDHGLAFSWRVSIQLVNLLQILLGEVNSRLQHRLLKLINSDHPACM